MTATVTPTGRVVILRVDGAFIGAYPTVTEAFQVLDAYSGKGDAR